MELNKQYHAILTGTKPSSIARVIAASLNKIGWHTWLYSRKVQPSDKNLMHIRQCDVTNHKQITQLIEEIPSINLAINMADSGTAFGELTLLSPEDITSFVDVKVTGSLLLSRAILQKSTKQNIHTKLVWTAGKPTDNGK